MTLYNDFRKQMVENTNLEAFANVFLQEEQTKGHVIFFGLPENYCKYKQSKVEWNESIYHREEAKVGCIFNFGKKWLTIIDGYFRILDGN